MHEAVTGDPRRAPSTTPRSAAAAAAQQGASLLPLRTTQGPLTVDDLMLGCAFNKPDDDGSLRLVGRTAAVATVSAALRLGVRSIDTAPLYGAGLSEEYIGESVGDALAEAGLGAGLCPFSPAAPKCSGPRSTGATRVFDRRASASSFDGRPGSLQEIRELLLRTLGFVASLFGCVTACGAV